MRKRLVVTLGLALLGMLLLCTTALAGPFPPAQKLGKTSTDTPAPMTVKWFLKNGAFDDRWDGDVPSFWEVYADDADAYGSLDFVNPDATGEVADQAFVFHIDNDEVKGDHNAYLYQEIKLPSGDYCMTAHSTIYAMDSKPGALSTGSDYLYMTYYALVPSEDALSDGVLMPDAVSEDDWRELWPYPSVCREDIKAGRFVGGSAYCDYVKRAETVSVTEGDYVFILRAELKWPDWRAFAYYIFDDMQIIAATPFADNWNECVTSFCLEGLLKR